MTFAYILGQKKGGFLLTLRDGGSMLERSIEIKLVLGQKLCDISRQFILLLNVVCAVTTI
jgi:hypothetical protein